MMQTPHLDIQNIFAGYGDRVVLQDISLSVLPGETFGLIGLNGAGKTTLLKTILGLKEAMSGTIAVQGHAAGSLAAKKLLCFLPERFDPAWFLNAYEFVDFTLSLYDRKVSKSRIDEMAEALGFNKSFLPRRAQTYSKGMRQKLGLMTTLLTDCPLLILDEPMSGLDPLARAQVKNLLAQARKNGRTVFLSSHILSDMEEICDRVAVIHNGKLLFIGKPSDLLGQTGTQQLEQAFLQLIGVKLAAVA
jgi:ABC-2 type transport system ATP-binding protein